MTILIGLLCSDGVVLGSDSSSTFGSKSLRTIEQQTKKIDIVNDSVIVAGTGQVGLGQRFGYIVKQCWDDKVFQKPYQEVGRTLCEETRKNFASTGVSHGEYGALVAYGSGSGFYLCEFSVQDFQPEFKDKKIWYVSMGSGQLIIDPFLGFLREIFWENTPPSLNEGVFYVLWALHHVIQLNPGGINGPMQIATLKRSKGALVAHILEDSEIQEHNNNVEGVIRHISQYKDVLQGRGPVATPDIP